MRENDDYTVRRPADFDYSAAIAGLEEQVRRKGHLQTTLAHFEADVARLSLVADQRREELALETADVERLRRLSPAVLLYTLTGRRGKMIDREEAEALAAAALYETAKNQLEYAEARVREIRFQLRSMGNCERRLAEMMEEAKEKRRAEDAAFSAELAEREQRIREMDRELTELDEAIDRGERVRGIIRGIRNQLDSAHDLSVADTFPIRSNVGGFIHDKAKYEHLDMAQSLLDRLGQYLQEFAAELEDVDFDCADMPATVQIRGGARVMDLYLDDIFADFAVRRRIEGSILEVEVLSERVTSVLDGLNALRQAKGEIRAAAEAELRRFVEGR